MMRNTLGAFVLALLLTVSISAGVMQNDSQAPPPAPTPEATPTPTPDGVMQNDDTEGLMAEIVLDMLLGVLALY